MYAQPSFRVVRLSRVSRAAVRCHLEERLSIRALPPIGKDSVSRLFLPETRIGEYSKNALLYGLRVGTVGEGPSV